MGIAPNYGRLLFKVAKSNFKSQPLNKKKKKTKKKKKKVKTNCEELRLIVWCNCI